MCNYKLIMTWSVLTPRAFLPYLDSAAQLCSSLLACPLSRPGVDTAQDFHLSPMSLFSVSCSLLFLGTSWCCCHVLILCSGLSQVWAASLSPSSVSHMSLDSVDVWCQLLQLHLTQQVSAVLACAQCISVLHCGPMTMHFPDCLHMRMQRTWLWRVTLQIQ